MDPETNYETYFVPQGVSAELIATETLGALTPSFAMMGEMGGFDAVALQKYHAVEKINHIHTAGNSSGIVDGAALVLIGSEAVGKTLGLTPRARIVASAVSGADATIMLTGPTPATEKVLATAGLTVDDIDLFELNEAFASVVLKFQRDLKIPDEKAPRSVEMMSSTSSGCNPRSP